MSDTMMSGWRRPRVRVAGTYREHAYTPESLEVEIDDDHVPVADIVAILTAMSKVAYMDHTNHASSWTSYEQGALLK